MSSADEISAGPRIREKAEWLLAEWTSQETSPFLRNYLDHFREVKLPAINGENRHRGVVYHDELPFAMWCMRPLTGDTAEVLGPYVVDAARRNGVGSLILVALLSSAAFSNYQRVAMPVNAPDAQTHEWLERRGLFEIPRYLEDPGRTHVAYGCDLAEQAALTLEQNGVPSGRGKWSVVVHNDDSTPADFVSLVLISVADLRRDLAEAATRRVHLKGRQIIRHCRTRGGAMRLADALEQRARAHEHPLRVTVERHDDRTSPPA